MPKWTKKTDPLSWFLLVRDTKARYQEATFPIFPDEDMIDTGPKKIDYYVSLWHELKNRYKTMFQDPDYQDRYFCFKSNTKWKPRED